MAAEAPRAAIGWAAADFALAAVDPSDKVWASAVRSSGAMTATLT